MYHNINNEHNNDKYIDHNKNYWFAPPAIELSKYNAIVENGSNACFPETIINYLVRLNV